jgi:hypothetical protein
MRPLFCSKSLIALVVAVAAAVGAMSQAQDQPVPPPSADAELPAGIVSDSPLADVIKMIQAGIETTTIKSYILSSKTQFNLDADKVIYMKDLGASSDLINAMMDRDKVLFAYSVNVPPPNIPAPAPPPPVADATLPPPSPPLPPVDGSAPPDTAPPDADVTINYFDSALAPYGTWVDIEGYGRCWQPTAVVYDNAWTPYCDRGHWVYTDYGWYWDSDYSWGATFHYGRWFHHDRFGWCWYPDTVWAPSWVAWRSGGDYCGWAPLPPFAVYHPGVGFFYRGVFVDANFEFGLAPESFVFLSAGHFCDRHPRSFAVGRDRVHEVFHQTSIVNHFDVAGKTVMNRGFGADRIAAATHRPIEPMHVSALPNAGRQGWRGEGFERTLHAGTEVHNAPAGGNSGHSFASGNSPAANNQFHQENQVQAVGSIRPGGWPADPAHAGAQYPQAGAATRVSSQAFNNGPQVHTVNSSVDQNHPGTPNQWPQSQPQFRQYGTLTEPSHTVPQNQWQQTQMPQQTRPINTIGQPVRPVPQNQFPQNQWQQNQNPGAPASQGFQQRGAVQWPQQPVAPAPPPRAPVEQSAAEPARNYTPPPPAPPAPQQQQAQPQQSRGSGNNNYNYNGNGGSAKQGH